MNKKLTVLVLTGALACSMALPAMAAQTAAVPISAPVSTEAAVSLPGSVLYYGTVQEIVKDAEGNIAQLRMTSDRYGEYVMNITEQTVWIDSGRKEASDPATLQEGERVYIFHSAVETRSLPPQSAAFAVVRNIPMDARCAQYHKVEAVSLENGQLTIATDNGGLHLMADQDTALSFYGSDKAAALEDIQAGGYVMAWYSTVAASEPGQAHATHLMLLPGETQVQDNMYVATLPFFPLVKEVYDIEKVKPTEQIMMQLYPEIYSCVGCNACTKVCPQSLNVMQYIAYAQRGEYEKCAEESFDCVMCGICSSRCPAGISHPQVAMLARRLNGKYLAPHCDHLDARIAEIENGDYVPLIEALMDKPLEEIQTLYNNREIEK